MKQVSDINKINRFKDSSFYENEFLSDLLWSDPAHEKKDMRSAFRENLNRGTGQVYGLRAVRKFLNDNKLVSIIRAHEPPQDGVDFHRFGEKDTSFPSVITLFSAPSYPMDAHGGQNM